ncbi:MAG TPA: hypothetical protein VK304_05560, partial [Thermoleophilaceae bacterium]|nr:hypothetical protein [Thermoleophilaceae bacterium]
EVVLRYHGADLHPGSAGEAASAGPLVLGRETANRPVSFVPPSRARSLCGQRLDWVEAVER